MTFAPLLSTLASTGVVKMDTGAVSGTGAAPIQNRNTRLLRSGHVTGELREERMTICSRRAAPARLVLPIFAIALVLAPLGALASPLSPVTRSRLAGGQSTWVIVEVDARTTDRNAEAERARRRIGRDDSALLRLRAQGYAASKTNVESAVTGPDAVKVRDYEHFPITLWRISSPDALQRLERNSLVRAVHENIALHPVSVSDLAFINQPQTAAEGATGAGTTIAVIDGGLGSNYLNFFDFGTCTGIGVPASTCRVVYNHDYYPGASSVTVHGTNVSAIALGVAGGSKLAMFDVFNGSSATAADVLDAMNTAISIQSTYNVVALNMSLGDGSSHSTQCTGSVFASAVTSARNAGILTVAAAGNSGSKTGLADPACAPGAVSVGAVYDASHGTLTWNAGADAGGHCTDASAADKVTCFSQSASYLSVLAPGTFVNAPNSTFQQSGTSQATPHIAGAVAVLRARYPAEPLSQTVQRLQISGVQDTDAANNLTVGRLNLLAATNQGTAIALAGSGPGTAVFGATSTYTLTVTNSGPLAATNVTVTDILPPAATFNSASAGCTFASQKVTCAVANLAVGASVTLTITVTWNASGGIYDSATVAADQTNTSPQQMVAFGNPPESSGDAPLPAWAYTLLGVALFGLLARRVGAA
jgi:uncharacterized repeat protein (TIGR01451 family)